MSEIPKVSVCMITYGHEEYIREAVEGVLMQKTSFPIELVLANDCSPDKTDQIIQDILNNHPYSSKIKYIKQPQNIGMMPNFIDAIKTCKGEYIALCEGDDYWTNPYKLQRQVDLLEAKPYIHLCFHNAYVGKSINDCIVYPKDIHQLPSILSSNTIAKLEWVSPTSSLMFRNIPSRIPYHVMMKFHVGDIPLIYFILGPEYNAEYINETWSFYRKHSEGVSIDHVKSNLNFISKRYFMYIILDKYFKGEINFKYQLNRYLNLIIESYYRRFTKGLYRRINRVLITIFKIPLTKKIINKYNSVIVK